MKSLLVFLVFLSIIGSGISSASAATVTVKDGATNTEIQSIIDGAQSGDTIKFLGSEYDNISLVINKTLNLAGAAGGTAVKAISNWSYIPSTVQNNGINNTAAFYFLNAAECSISGFNITSMANSASSIGYNNTLIYAQNASKLNIYNNNLNFSSWGIYSNVCPNVIINNNTVSNMTTTGIISFGSAYALITNNTVLNCANHGIDVRHGLGPNATVCGNLINGASEGIYLMHSAGHDVYNNTILNCALSSITAYGAGNINITNNTMTKSLVGVMLASGFYNVSIQNNNYSLTTTAFPYTFPYYVMVADSSTGSKTTANGTFTDSARDVSDISMSSSYSNSSITNGKSTTYTVKVSNNGNGAASNVNISKILPSSNYTSYKVVAVSKGSFNSATGTWNVGNLSSGNEAMIVFTVTAKKAGSISTSASANYTDYAGDKSLNALKSTLTINKDIKLSYTNTVSSTKIKKGKYVYIASAVSNTGIDKSGTVKIKITLPAGMKLIAVNYPSVYNSATKTWTFTVPASKVYTFKVKAQVTSTGSKKITFNDNGKIQYKYITGY
jgi:uncharacterized repeat protein (TIGR01451 family)